jgi:hypothetical protein
LTEDEKKYFLAQYYLLAFMLTVEQQRICLFLFLLKFKCTFKSLFLHIGVRKQEDGFFFSLPSVVSS